VSDGGGITLRDIIESVLTSIDIAVLSTLLLLGPQEVAELAAASAVWEAARHTSDTVKVLAHKEDVLPRRQATHQARARSFEVGRCSRLTISSYSVPATEDAAWHARQRVPGIASEALEALKRGEWRRAVRLLQQENIGIGEIGETKSVASVLVDMILNLPSKVELHRTINQLMWEVKTEEEVVGVVYTLSGHPISKSVKRFYKGHIDWLYWLAARYLENAVLSAATARAASEVINSLSGA